MESSSNTKEGERQMEATKNQKKLITFTNEHYQLSRIREIKLMREICNGEQRKITEWAF